MPENDVTKIISDSIIKNHIALERFSEGIKEKVFDILTKAQNEIAGQIASIDPMAPALTKWRRERLEKLNTKITEIIDQSYKEIKSLSAKDMKNIAKSTLAGTPKMLNAAVGANIFDVTLTPELLKSIVTNTMIDGHIIGEWWNKQSTDTKARLIGQMNQIAEQLQLGMVKGEAIGEMISRIRGTKLTPGVMSISKREAAALTRTSFMQVAQNARMKVYKQNSDVLKGYQFVATLDMRTTPLCRGIDLKMYDGDFKPVGHSFAFPGTPPLHWNCRTSLVPITLSYRELIAEDSGLTNKQKKAIQEQVPESKRASMGGPIKDHLNYNDWLLGQSEEIQKDVLGIQRQRLWKENKIGMEDLIHQTGRQLTLDELKLRLADPDYIPTKIQSFVSYLKDSAEKFLSLDEFSTFINTLPDKQFVEQALSESKLTAEKIWKSIDRKVDEFIWKEITDSENIYFVYNQFGNIGVSANQNQLKAINTIGKEFTRLHNDFPGIQKVLGKEYLRIDLIDAKVIQTKTGDASGVYKIITKDLSLSTKGSRMKEGLISKGGYSTNKSFPITFRHEYGHHFYYHSIYRSDWIKLYKSQPKSYWAKQVTKYGSSEAAEAFAESFAIFTHPEYTKGFLDKPIEDFLTKLLFK